MPPCENSTPSLKTRLGPVAARVLFSRSVIYLIAIAAVANLPVIQSASAAAQVWDDADIKRYVLRAPHPVYPDAARRNWLEGSGVFELTVRPDGTVTDVTTVRSTGHSLLDRAALQTLKTWQIRPLPEIGHIRVPVRFVMNRGGRSGRNTSGIGVRGETLSASQLNDAIISAPRIHYPKLSRKLRSQGTGSFEIRIDPATGKVIEVVILKSTGARILDIECLRALRQWRFKPGRVRVVRHDVTFRLSWRATVPESGQYQR